VPAAPLPPIRRALIDELLRQLGIAREQIEESLRTATSADVARRLQRQRAEIDRVLGVFRGDATAAAIAGADQAWAAGVSQASASALRINTRALLAVRNMLTDRIKDVSQQAIRQINTALTQHLLGVRTLSQTISDIQAILDHAPRRRAMTIAYTEIGRAYNAAHYEALLEQARRIPGLKKRWIHSGKAHGRPGHIHAAQQEPIPVEEPFEIVDPKTGEVEQLRFPLDPNASAKNTINCGCMMESVLPSVEDIFAGPIGPIVQPGDGTRNGVPLPNPAPPVPAAKPATTPPAAPKPPNPSTSSIDDIFAGPIGPIVQPGTIVRNGVVVQEPAGMLANHAPPAAWERAGVGGLSQALADALIQLERELPTRAVEWAYLLDETGAVLWSAEGTRKLVRLEGLAVSVARGAVLTHTHFDDALPSIFDIFAAAGREFAEMRVAGPNVRHRLLPPLSGWNLAALLRQEHELRAYARSLRDDLRKAGAPESEYDRRILAGLIEELVRRGLIRIETYRNPTP